MTYVSHKKKSVSVGFLKVILRDFFILISMSDWKSEVRWQELVEM